MVRKFIGIAMVIAASSALYPHPARSGGGEIPTPLDVGPGKTELADGEKYFLHGRFVVASTGTVFFQIDLTKHRALANQLRVQFPFYPVTDQVESNLAKYRNKAVKIYIEAQGQVLVSSEGKASYVIMLKLLSEPEIE
jgi:hypothetical protein